MLSIDEAITRERQIAKEQRSHIGTWYSKIMGYDDEYIKKCEVCAEEHEQLAEWLEELKMYKEVGTVEGYKSAIECYNEEYTMRKSNKQYKKAIDDFANKLINYVDCGHLCEPLQVRWSDYSVVEMVKRMAEQLKVGGKNEM